MPSGKTHDKITWIFFPILSFIVWDVIHNILITITFAISYLFSSFMFSGDLDLVSQQSKRWGVLRWIWIPYRKYISHRSDWSHGILLGTVFRIFYLFILIGFFYTFIYFLSKQFLPDLNKELVKTTEHSLLTLNKVSSVYYSTIFIGLLCGAAIHTLADETGSFIKRWYRKFSKKKNKSKKKR